MYAVMLCAFPNCPFSLLSQVFSFSSALLTAHELFGVSHRCIFFCHPPCPHQKKTLFSSQKHLKRPRIHQPYLSLHTSSSFFFPELLCHMLSIFFLADITFVKLEKKTKQKKRQNSLKALSNLADSSAFALPQVGEFTVNPQCERFSEGTLRHAAQKLHFPRCTGLETTGLLSCSGSCVVIDSSAPLVARAP